MTDETKLKLAQFDELDWFSKAGQPLRDTNTKQVGSWTEAIKMCGSRDSANVRLESQNILTEKLCFEWPDRYHGKWNPLVATIKKRTEPIALERAVSSPHSPKLPKGVVDALRWDLLMIMMELEYADIVPPRFFAERAKWYLAGHFPCGWEGEFPEGRLIVY